MAAPAARDVGCADHARVAGVQSPLILFVIEGPFSGISRRICALAGSINGSLLARSPHSGVGHRWSTWATIKNGAFGAVLHATRSSKTASPPPYGCLWRPYGIACARQIDTGIFTHTAVAGVTNGGCWHTPPEVSSRSAVWAEIGMVSRPMGGTTRPPPQFPRSPRLILATGFAACLSSHGYEAGIPHAADGYAGRCKVARRSTFYLACGIVPVLGYQWSHHYGSGSSGPGYGVAAPARPLVADGVWGAEGPVRRSPSSRWTRPQPCCGAADAGWPLYRPGYTFAHPGKKRALRPEALRFRPEGAYCGDIASCIPVQFAAFGGVVATGAAGKK